MSKDTKAKAAAKLKLPKLDAEGRFSTVVPNLYQNLYASTVLGFVKLLQDSEEGFAPKFPVKSKNITMGYRTLYHLSMYIIATKQTGFNFVVDTCCEYFETAIPKHKKGKQYAVMLANIDLALDNKFTWEKSETTGKTKTKLVKVLTRSQRIEAKAKAEADAKAKAEADAKAPETPETPASEIAGEQKSEALAMLELRTALAEKVLAMTPAMLKTYNAMCK